MPEEIRASPGWVDERLDEIFGALPNSPAVTDAKRAYADCLATAKSPAAPSDMLGAEFEPCRAALTRSLLEAGVTEAGPKLTAALEALEAEIAADS